jgi:2-dehydro-3-deoxyphosphogalactonate aldolase
VTTNFNSDPVPVIAILRGVRPDEVIAVASALVDAGIRSIEVPLNSPSPLESISRLSKAFADHGTGDPCLIGAGTVLTPADVDAVAQSGGKLIVTPNTDPAVIERAVALKLDVVPGFATPSEAFRALQAGARSLKLFPASTFGPVHIKALRDVLPKGIKLFAVGGVGALNLTPWLEAGIDGIGVGGELFRPGYTPEEVSKRAAALVQAWRTAAAARNAKP